MQYNITQTSLYTVDNKITDHFKHIPKLPKVIIRFIRSVPLFILSQGSTRLIIWMDEFSDKFLENKTFHVKYTFLKILHLQESYIAGDKPGRP